MAEHKAMSIASTADESDWRPYSSKSDATVLVRLEEIGSKAQTPQGPPQNAPDGGLMGWIQCAAAFCIFFNTWGLLNTFGADPEHIHIAENVADQL